MARYEKTIAGNDYVFAITLPTADFEYIMDLLTPGQQDQIRELFINQNIVDGYVVCYQGPFSVTRAHDEAGVETVLTNEKYTCPIENWPERIMVKAGSTMPALVRIFVS